MKVGSVTDCKKILDYCTGNRCKKFLIEKLDNEILKVLSMPINFLMVYVYIIHMRM